MRRRLWVVLALLLGLIVPGGAVAAPNVGGVIVVGAGGATVGYVTRIAVEPQGAPLRFYNLDQIAHTVTSVDRDAEGRPLFSAGASPSKTTIVSGISKLRAGSYAFFCSFHPNMTGTLLVQGGSGGIGPTPPRFEQKLRIPPTLTGSAITLTAEQADVHVLPRKPATSMMTYNGSWPGPTIRRPVGQKTVVTVVNKLNNGFGPITLHLHGDHHSSADDGQPDSQLISAGRKKAYTFPFRDGGKPERAAFSFYHDHKMDMTGRNNWYGLQGMLITDDPAEARLGLPTGAYDLPLLVADRSFDESGQLIDPFPKQSDAKQLLAGIDGPYAPPGDATTGSRTLVNGVFQPYADVATHRYRLRLLNASPFTSYDFRFTDGRPMVQVGNGSGLLPKSVSRTDVLLGPAERADVVVDFGKDFNSKLVLESVARVDDRPGGIGSPATPVMQFRVSKRTRDVSRVPSDLVPLPPLAVPAAPTMTWNFGLGAKLDQLATTWTVNGKPYDHMRVDATVPLGSVQHWLLVNSSTTTHFIHLHEETWRTVARNGQPPPAWEAGFQDTWRLDPGEFVEVAARFTDYTGPFMIHCHMLDHEDHGMMATFQVVKPGAAAAATPVAHQHLSGTSLSAITAAALCRRKEML